MRSRDHTPPSITANFASNLPHNLQPQLTRHTQARGRDDTFQQYWLHVFTHCWDARDPKRSTLAREVRSGYPAWGRIKLLTSTRPIDAQVSAHRSTVQLCAALSSFRKAYRVV